MYFNENKIVILCFIDFFIAVIMLLKCSHPKDLIELMDTCIFPIIEYYLNNQQNDINAIKIMELISKYKLTLLSLYIFYTEIFDF